MKNDTTGMSLVELVVYVAVASILMIGLSSILIAGLTSTMATADRDAATGQLQAISASLSTDIRDAGDVRVDTTSTASIVRARIADGALGWECRAWAIVDLAGWGTGTHLREPDGVFELRGFSYEPLVGSALAPPPTLDWGVLAREVRRVAIPTPTPSPGVTPTPMSAPADSTQHRAYFTISGTSVSWSLSVVASNNGKVSDEQVASLSGSAAATAFTKNEGTPSRCW